MTNTPDLLAALDAATAEARTHYGPTPTPEPVAAMWALADYDRLALCSLANGRRAQWDPETRHFHRDLFARGWVGVNENTGHRGGVIVITDAGRAATGQS